MFLPIQISHLLPLKLDCHQLGNVLIFPLDFWDFPYEKEPDLNIDI